MGVAVDRHDPRAGNRQQQIQPQASEGEVDVVERLNVSPRTKDDGIKVDVSNQPRAAAVSRAGAAIEPSQVGDGPGELPLARAKVSLSVSRRGRRSSSVSRDWCAR
jgi:hypothetical protein